MRKTFVALVVLLIAALAWAAPEKRPAYLKVKAFKPRHGRTFVSLDAPLMVSASP